MKVFVELKDIYFCYKVGFIFGGEIGKIVVCLVVGIFIRFCSFEWLIILDLYEI